LAEATAGLAERGDITVPALYSRLAGTSLFSDAVRPLLDLTPAEIVHGLDRAAPLLAERAPVLLEDAETDDGTRPGFTRVAEQIRGLLGADATQLSDTARAEHRKAPLPWDKTHRLMTHATPSGGSTPSGQRIGRSSSGARP
ncbi:MAG: repeat protein, partial [Thermomicrobiales bacterium]|nr:repeat protein [Thermomicrobiales bacterium]